MSSSSQGREYKMKIDPKILRLLGPNLYTNIYFVLAELIANAYDADADNVYIISKADRIIVEDDGLGMSYEKGVKKYLNVAEETRTSEKDSYTSKKRRRIGRKGVGKLSALSVSERVLVRTKVGEDKSGFVLSREISKDGLLESLSDQDINFEKIQGDHGTSVVMENPRYVLNKTTESVKKNLLKIFPLVNELFRIHIITEEGEEIIDNFDKEMISQLGCLIILGKNFHDLSENFNNDYPSKEKQLIKKRETVKIKLDLTNKKGEEKKYDLIIKGWIGTYRSTRGRKNDYVDFPDNFISLFANGKLGEYNILPVVSKNKLIEVFVVGQLHVDLFEETELPDMSLSNRQGYKTDDLRYKKVIEYVGDHLLTEILDLRKAHTDYKNERKEQEKTKKQKEQEEELKRKVDEYRKQMAEKTIEKLDALKATDKVDSLEKIKAIVEEEANALLPIVGLKSVVDSQKKKVLISHTAQDEDVANVIYAMLLFNNVPSEDIIYSSSEDEEARIPDGAGIFDYLRYFFMESYSQQGIYVVYVTSKAMEESWGAVLEAGAGWITQIAHKIFNVAGYTPQPPLNVAPPWHTTTREGRELVMTSVEWDKFAVRIEKICDYLDYPRKTREQNKNQLKQYVVVKN